MEFISENDENLNFKNEIQQKWRIKIQFRMFDASSSSY